MKSAFLVLFSSVASAMLAMESLSAEPAASKDAGSASAAKTAQVEITSKVDAHIVVNGAVIDKHEDIARTIDFSSPVTLGGVTIGDIQVGGIRIKKAESPNTNATAAPATKSAEAQTGTVSDKSVQAEITSKVDALTVVNATLTDDAKEAVISPLVSAFNASGPVTLGGVTIRDSQVRGVIIKNAESPNGNATAAPAAKSAEAQTGEQQITITGDAHSLVNGAIIDISDASPCGGAPITIDPNSAQILGISGDSRGGIHINDQSPRTTPKKTTSPEEINPKVRPNSARLNDPSTIIIDDRVNPYGAQSRGGIWIEGSPQSPRSMVGGLYIGK